MKGEMECVECDYPHALKAKPIIHKYKESGLNYITLSKVNEYKCPQCGAVYLEIPKAQELHNLIANMLLKKATPLTGSEIRFLRKQLGYSSQKFGELISYDPKTLSRIENGHQKVDSSFDRLVRMAYATGKRDLQYNLHDFLLGEGVSFRRLELAIEGKKEWTVKKAAA